jgi:glycosyltransferase involved in cell wall biosynthesis
MVLAVSTQNIKITIFNFDEHPIEITRDNLRSNPYSISRNFRNRNFFDGIINIYIFIKLLLSIRPDIIHVNALQDILPVFIATQICAIRGQRPRIIAMSHNPLSWKNPKKIYINTRIIKYFSDGFIALSTTHKNQLVHSGVASNKIAIIPNPYDPAQININVASTQYKEYKSIKINKLIYVADISERKAQDVLITAAPHILEKYPNTTFTLIGRINSKEEIFFERLNHLIKEYGIEDSVVLTGEIPYSDVLTSLLECDIFIFPSLAEMMPRAVIEAMVIGKPVIASAIDGIIDLIENRKTGILVQPRNVEELAEAACELIANPNLAHDIGLAGQRFIINYCSPEKVGNQIRMFYEQIINARS